MAEPRLLGRDEEFGRDLFLLELVDPGELPSKLNLPSRHFACLLVMDARSVSDAAIQQLAESLALSGLANLCTWGPDCERVHDISDRTFLDKGLQPQTDDDVIITSWHDRQSLEDALQFFLYNSEPTECYSSSCGTGMAITIGSREWRSIIEEALSDVRAFKWKSPRVKDARQLLILHQEPRILVFPNVWDVASAKLVERAGFPAVATSSAAIAFAHGYPDGQRIRREEMLAAVARIAESVFVPVTADLEAGYGTSLEEIARTAEELLEAGAVGLNFEDGTGDAANPLADVAEQTERIRTIRETGKRAGVHIVINARTDVFLDEVGEPASRFENAVRRANAYREAGGDCLFIPGVQDAETIGKLVKAVHGPINILAGPTAPPMGELERLGVRRVSFGS